VGGQAEDYAGLKDRLQQSFSRHSVQLEMWRSRIKLGPLSANDAVELLKLLSSLQSKRELSSLLNARFCRWKLMSMLGKIDTLSDNRDRTILPNSQPAAEMPIFGQSQVVPETDQAWLCAIADAYSRLVNPSPLAVQSGSIDQQKADHTRMTGVEIKFCKWAEKVEVWLSGKEAKVEDIVITGFLKGWSS
jgi:hypothetical protein